MLSRSALRAPLVLTQHRSTLAHRKARRLAAGRIVATSEHWYEEEDEFDAVREGLRPKLLFIVSAPASSSPSASVEEDESLQPVLRSYLEPQKFTSAFSSEAQAGFASAIWRGRDGPPFFLKVRTRRSLDAAAEGAQSAADEFLGEVLQQTWRKELDYGLGSEGPEAAEALLVVCSPAAADELLSACGVDATKQGAVRAVEVGAAPEGSAIDWRQLSKRLLGATTPGSITGAGGTVMSLLREEKPA
jgi:hypothetical protein